MLFKILPWLAAILALVAVGLLYLTNTAIQQALAVMIGF